MKNVNLNEISFEDIARAPCRIKLLLILLMSLLIMMMAYWFDLRNEMQQLKKSKLYEFNLHNEYTIKNNIATQLKVYKQQLAQLTRQYNLMMNALVSDNDIPTLLENIEKLSETHSLKIQRITPMEKIQYHFMREYPIKFSLNGYYHSLAQLITDIANYRQLVTVDDFFIRLSPLATDDQILQIDLLLKIYQPQNDQNLRKTSMLDEVQGAKVASSGVYMRVNEQRSYFSNTAIRQQAKFCVSLDRTKS